MAAENAGHPGSDRMGSSPKGKVPHAADEGEMPHTVGDSSRHAEPRPAAKNLHALPDWRVLNKGSFSEPAEASVQAGADDLGRPCRIIRQLRADWPPYGLESPLAAVESGGYYRLAFRWRANVSAFWEAQFYSDPDKPSTDFHTAGIAASPDGWSECEYFFPAKVGVRWARIILWAGRPCELAVSGMEFSPATKQQAWEWFAGLVRTNPPLPADDGAPKGTLIPRTLARLRSGQKTVIAHYGDSISFDIGNMPLGLALEHAYPGAKVDVLTRAKGSAGWCLLAQPQVLQERILAVRPDLVIALDESWREEDGAAALGRIIDTCRAECGTEFLLLTTHMIEGRYRGDYARLSHETRQLAAAKRCELVEFREFFNRFLEVNFLNFTWPLRDGMHLNERGRAMVLSLLLRHLAPGFTP